jgi:glycerol-3-phosphate dehydrogenase
MRSPVFGRSMTGGDISGTFDDFVADLARDYAGLPQTLVHHCARLYGTRARELLGSARSCADLGCHFGGDLYEREASYLRETEWARRAADVLERRTKHRLHLTPAQRAVFEASVGS